MFNVDVLSSVDTFTFPKSGSEGSLFCVFSEFVCSCHVELLCTQVCLLSFDLSTWTRERHLFAENYTETHSWAAPASSFISTAHLVEKRPKVEDPFNLSIWWSDTSSQLFPSRVGIVRKKLLVETKSFPQIMLGGSPEQQEKVHTQGSVTNLMALNLIWKQSK